MLLNHLGYHMIVFLHGRLWFLFKNYNSREVAKSNKEISSFCVCKRILCCDDWLFIPSTLSYPPTWLSHHHNDKYLACPADLANPFPHMACFMILSQIRALFSTISSQAQTPSTEGPIKSLLSLSVCSSVYPSVS